VSLRPTSPGVLASSLTENECAPETSRSGWDGPDDELLDARQAAGLLTVKPSTLLHWARVGTVPCVRLGPRHLRWTRPMLREVVAARTEAARAQWQRV